MQASIEGEEKIESRIGSPVALKEEVRSSELDFNLQSHLLAQDTSGARVDVRGEKEGAPKKRQAPQRKSRWRSGGDRSRYGNQKKAKPGKRCGIE